MSDFPSAASWNRTTDGETSAWRTFVRPACRSASGPRSNLDGFVVPHREELVRDHRSGQAGRQDRGRAGGRGLRELSDGPVVEEMRVVDDEQGAVGLGFEAARHRLHDGGVGVEFAVWKPRQVRRQRAKGTAARAGVAVSRIRWPRGPSSRRAALTTAVLPAPAPPTTIAPYRVSSRRQRTRSLTSADRSISGPVSARLSMAGSSCRRLSVQGSRLESRAESARVSRAGRCLPELR